MRAPFTVASTLAGWRHSGDRKPWRYAVLLLAGALSVCAGSGVAVAQSASVVRPVAVDPYAAHITEASQRFGIPEHWIRAVLRAESAGDVRAISSAGAMGLMQVMPDTWAGLRVRYRLGRDPYDPRDNILAGTAYLREMWDRYGNVGAMLAAYNAGPGRYDEHRRPADRCRPRHAPMSPRSRRSLAVRLHRKRRHRHRHRRPIGATHRSLSCGRMTAGQSPRSRPTRNPATLARPFRCAIPPLWNRKTAAFL